MSFLLSSSERQYILNGCRDNCRTDGRTCDELRLYTIVVGGDNNNGPQQQQQQQHEETHDKPPPLVLSNGSSRLFLAAPGSASSTHILCSVKAELVHPSLHNPHQGQIQIHVDYAAAASAATAFVSATSSSGGGMMSRQQQQESYDYIQSTLSRLLQTHLLDLNALCIVPYHYVWNLQIDLLVLSGMGGNLIDACSHALRAALQQTLLPLVSTTTTTSEGTAGNSTTGTPTSANADLLVDSDIQHAFIPPGSDKAPIIVTVTVIKDDDNENNGDDNDEAATSGWYLLLDATLEEQACSYCQIHVAVQSEYICALTKSGGGSIPLALLTEITSLALEFSKNKEQQKRYNVTSLPDNNNNANYGWLQEQFSIQ